MADIEIELNDEGIIGLLQSNEILAEMKKYGRTMLSGLGEGYAMDDYVGKTRCNVSVYAASKEAYKDNLENNTLLKAVK